MTARASRLWVENHRGVRVPRTLGFALIAGAAGATVVRAVVDEVDRVGWTLLAALVAVFAAGLLDDLGGGEVRGLRNHARALLRGRVTTGIVKVVVIAASALVVAFLGLRLPVGEGLVTGVAIAASANVWNGLDVRPGRAIKAFLPPAAAFVVGGDPGAIPAIAGVAAAAAVVLPADLRERAMLGDAGSNVLGFAAGVALASLAEGAWLWVLAGALIGLNVIAETVTFSRVIDGWAPLRWIDRLGRRA